MTKKASDAELLAAYAELQSVKKVAVKFGMCGQSVHERLVRLGANRRKNVMTEKELDFLKAHYVEYRNAKRLDELAHRLGRTKQFICRKARTLGLTDITRSYEPQEIRLEKGGYLAVRGKGELASNRNRHVHRIIAEKMIGRPLRSDEHVHHIDGNKQNNAPENLRVMSKSEHMTLHHRGAKRRRKPA